VLGLYFHVPMNGTTACEKLFIILEVEDGDMEIKKANRPVKGTDSIIELDDVSFAYVENQPVLKNANLKIRKDEFVSLVGKSVWAMREDTRGICILTVLYKWGRSCTNHSL